jgi:replicative DNA helicase
VLDDFHVIKHRRLWKVLEDYLTGGLEWDVRVIGQKAEAQGVTAEYVEMLAEVGDLNIGWHEDRIMDFSVRRGARADADRFRDLIADLRTPANQLIGTLTHAVTSKALQRGASAFRSIVDQVDSAVETMHARMKNPNELVGISFGSQLPTFDRNTQGIQPRRLYLIAATSSKGKSTIAGQWAVNWAVGSAVPVDFISLEMDETELLFKAASHLTGIDSMKISSGRLTEDEAKRVEKAMLRLRSSTLRIYAPDSLTTDEWLLYAREAVMERRTEVFVIDYAQMVGADGHELRSRRDEQLRRFAYESKLKVARGMETAVLIVAQLKRDAANKEEPTMEDMADCYDLSRAADVGFFLSQAEDSSLTDGWIGKNRQGPPGVRIPMHFDKPTGTFSEPQASKVPAYRILS